MSYEFRELFESCKVKMPFELNELDPVYAVNFAHREKPFYIHKDLNKLAEEFKELEPDFLPKVRNYLKRAGALFHDTEHRIVKRNYGGMLDHYLALSKVPLKHAPMLFRSMWTELGRHFDAEEVKIIFSLVAFFLGATPFDTPAVYALLNYTELEHDGYWNVKGGMYRIVSGMVELLKERGVEFVFNAEIVALDGENERVKTARTNDGRTFDAEIFVANADAAAFRGQVLGRPAYREEKLDKMHWTLAPFTIYLGVKGKIPQLHHHNYFLGSNFQEYAGEIFRTSVAPEKPYYYVNVSSRSNPDAAPEGCENLFILCPVPDLRVKPDWSDAEALAENILSDLSERAGFDLTKHTLTRTIYNPVDWRDQFNLYKGSGLGLAHDLNQIGGYRPSNKDEVYRNLFYVGASTVPGTGLPIVVISSRLATERIEKSYAVV